MPQIAPRGSAFRDDWLKLRHAPIKMVRSWQIVLQKSKIEGPRKFRKSGFLADSTAATLRRSDTRLGGRFSEKRMVPHVSARKAHWRSLEFSVVATKRLFQQYRHF
jgi:hypothetical protein